MKQYFPGLHFGCFTLNSGCILAYGRGEAHIQMTMTMAFIMKKSRARGLTRETEESRNLD
ncbi:hypothetical protein FJMB80067_29790 [Enterobacter hormaechei]|nr:hypothetical protein FJMB80067_29790 [Enterobacter hormaechei]